MKRAPYLIRKPIHILVQSEIGLYRRFSSDQSSDNNKKFDKSDELEGEESEKFETSLIRPTIPPETPELLAIPVTRRPVFPGFYKTISVKDPNVSEALRDALRNGKPYVGLFMSRELAGPNDSNDSDTIESLDNIHSVGVFAQVINVVPMPGSEGVTAIVYPHRRIRALSLLQSQKFSIIKNENFIEQAFNRKDLQVRAISQEIFACLADVAKLNAFFREHITHHNVPSSVFEDYSKLADFVAVLSSAESSELQSVLEESSVEERLRKSLILIKKELVTAQLQQSISKDVEQKLTQKQREYFLHEQLKSIKKELGLETDAKEKIMQLFNDRVALLSLPQQVKSVYDEEISKLSVLEPAGSEFNVTRNYLDWITQIPWNVYSSSELDIGRVAEILDQDHFGMKDVKERIMELMAVQALKAASSGKIICLVGPPGVGKTSVGKSIARALKREYYRFSVGGLTDMAEIKGHRRTYVGAMPGKIVQALKKVKTQNPLILIDEIDKLGRGHQGDPASALLEVLDPEQNTTFLDHYLDVPIDLSNVLFMCTANQTDTIPGPLLDRMEVINLAGYVSQEKLSIAKQYLIPNALGACGLENKLALTDDLIESINKYYCRESGVRNLKKQIEKICRKVALQYVRRDVDLPMTIPSDKLAEYIGNPIFTTDRLYTSDLLPFGVVTGMAWTSMGGAILYVESAVEQSDDHKPALMKTGQLGDVMKESCSIAYSFAKAFLNTNFQQNHFFRHAVIHLHVPEGATPKDGPSAGCTMATALLSLALKKAIPSDIAMTGELTLTGKILKIGGVKEKVIAAKRSGITRIIMPVSNKVDWEELQDYVKEDINAIFVENYSEIARALAFI